MKNVTIRIGEGLEIVYDVDKGHLGMYEGKELREEITEQFIRRELLRIIQAIMNKSYSLVNEKGESDVELKEEKIDFISILRHLKLFVANTEYSIQIREGIEQGNLETDYKHLYLDLANKLEKISEKLGINVEKDTSLETSLSKKVR